MASAIVSAITMIDLESLSEDEKWNLALKAREDQERGEVQKKEYWYGTIPSKNGPRLFIVRDKNKVPPNHLEVYGPVDSIEQVPTNVDQLETDRIARRSASGYSEIKAGMVALHHDQDGEHFVIVLEPWGRDRVACLFFTSSPNFGKVNRRATKEEIALAGFVTSKVTYLAGCVRDTADMDATGKSFSKERTSALCAEFFG